MVGSGLIGFALVVAIALASAKAFAQENLANGTSYEALEIVGKSAIDLINMRGYRSEVHTVRTKDGYLLQLIRVVNPRLPNGPTKRPVVFNHGLIESATIFLINSRDIVEARDLSQCHGDDIKEIYATNDTFYRSGPLMLANFGFDVYLLSMRGTDFSMKHVSLDSTSDSFWDYSLDDFSFHDLPSTINYVRRYTKAAKVGYVGHSQATLAAFSLLSSQPEYAYIMEPIIMIAPVSYVGNIRFSALKPIIQGIDRLTSDMSKGWERNGPYPKNARKARKTLHGVCKVKTNDALCRLVGELISGKGEAWMRGYWSQVPYFTSLKVMRHFAQLNRANKAQRYDYGEKKNMAVYSQPTPPEHPLENIISKSIVLIYSDADTLATLKDIEQLKARLRVPVKEVRITRDNFNHFDLITAASADNLVFKPMLEIFESYEALNGFCSVRTRSQQIHSKPSWRRDEELGHNRIDANGWNDGDFNTFHESGFN